MGVVYRSTHPRLDIPVAIKVLAEQYSDSGIALSHDNATLVKQSRRLVEAPAGG